MQLSKKFLVSLKLNQQPAYRIAQKAGVDPSMLSKLISGIVQVKQDDTRVMRVGKVLGLEPEECFKGGCQHGDRRSVRD